MVVMAKPRGRGKAATPSEFGWALDDAMRSAGITTASALAEMLNADGYKISPQMISSYRSGKNKVPVGFVSQVIRTLTLDEEQQDALAKAWAAVLPEDERQVVMRSWENRPTMQNLEMADKIEAEEQRGKADHQSEDNRA